MDAAQDNAALLKRIAQLEQSESRWRQEESRLRQENEELKRIRDGSFFTTISDLWTTGPAGVLSDGEVEQFKRRNASQVRVNPIDDARRYADPPYERATAFCTNPDDYEPAQSNHESGSGMSTARQNVVWPVNIFGMNDRCAEIAHLVPAAPAHAQQWWFVARWLMGWVQPASFRHLIMGLAGFKHGEKSGAPRTPGITKHAINKARIPGQCMDKHPCLLIVPILTKEQALAWTGDEYEAIVVIDAAEGVELSSVAANTGLSRLSPHQGLIATTEMVKTATALLAFVLQAIFTALKTPPDDINVNAMKVDIAARLDITVPKGLCTDNPRVCKVKFCAVDARNEMGHAAGHPAPDPVMLAAKAAVTFSVIHGYRMAAGASVYDEALTELDDYCVEVDHTYDFNRVIDWDLSEAAKPSLELLGV